jgi:hypothetical protein
MADDFDDQAALDAFAARGANAKPPATIPAAQVMGAGEGMRVVGAQKVAVKRLEADVLEGLRLAAAAAGEQYYYRWPVKVKDKRTGVERTEWVEGESVKLTNDLARLYGNCEVETRVVDFGESWMIYARFTDYETGFSMTRPFQQRKSQRAGTGDDAERARDIALQIGVSKATRNVITNALQFYSTYALREAKNSLVKKIGGDVAGYREKSIRRLAERGIDVKRVEPVFGRPAADWLAPDLSQLYAILKGIDDGFSTVDESFPPLVTAAGPTDKLDEFAKTDSGAPAQPATGVSSAADTLGPRAPDTAAENADNAISPPAKGVSAAEPSSTLDFGDAP